MLYSIRLITTICIIALLIILIGMVDGDKNKRQIPAVTPISRKFNPKDGAAMVYISAGEFLMGSKKGMGKFDEYPRHKVYLSGYYIYKNLVTVAQYRKFCQAAKRRMPVLPHWSAAAHPMSNVTWNDAAAYAEWAGVALPTEAQWEKAARGTDDRIYPWGNDWDAGKCVCNKLGTGPAGSHTAGVSPYGALDMAGNLWEWCADWYDAAYYKSSSARDPVGPKKGTERVVRGGSWGSISPDSFRSARRLHGNPENAYCDFGFRCVVNCDN